MVVVPVAVIALWLVSRGSLDAAGGFQLLVPLALALVSAFCVKRIFEFAADGFAKNLLSVYEDRCDPQLFVEQARDVADSFTVPFGELGTWFLSSYGLALADLGRLHESAEILERMRKSAEAAVSKKQLAAVLINTEPLAQRLMDDGIAISMLEKAREEIGRVGDGTGDARLSYIEWKLGVLKSRKDGNAALLLSSLREIRERKSCSWRLRVQCADEEAALCSGLGDALRERECLEFVVEHGNRLPSVKRAQRRLAELERFSIAVP